MTTIVRDWSKAPKVPYTITPERLAQITAEVNAENDARLFDMLNSVSSRLGRRWNIPAAKYPDGIRPGEMRERDGDAREAAAIAAWADLELYDLTA